MPHSDLPLGGVSAAEMLGPPGVSLPERLNRPGARQSDQALRRAARDFESILLHKLLQEMKNTIPDSGLAGSGATKQLQGLFWSFLARDLAEKGGLGLWKDLYAEWSAAAGGAAETAPTEPSP